MSNINARTRRAYAWIPTDLDFLAPIEALLTAPVADLPGSAVVREMAVEGLRSVRRHFGAIDRHSSEVTGFRAAMMQVIEAAHPLITVPGSPTIRRIAEEIIRIEDTLDPCNAYGHYSRSLPGCRRLAA